MTETTFEVFNPATGQLIERVADGTVLDATRAVDAAHAAFTCWAGTPSRTRAEILRRCYDLMIRDADSLSCLIATENGKSIEDASAEVRYAAEILPLVL